MSRRRLCSRRAFSIHYRSASGLYIQPKWFWAFSLSGSHKKGRFDERKYFQSLYNSAKVILDWPKFGYIQIIINKLIRCRLIISSRFGPKKLMRGLRYTWATYCGLYNIPIQTYVETDYWHYNKLIYLTYFGCLVVYGYKGLHVEGSS